ncbi:hypothetical protein WAF17_15985 [Bernardetia sp. ABR2-2B]|uniref:hypothetical protein n=1 Tax=Bernardetia sp. ABR2-2B TaxID=3127472 RepID=UPI0030D60507
MIHTIKKKIKRILGIEKYSSERIVKDTYFGKKIQDTQKGNKIIYDLLQSNKPCMIARFGSTELSCIINYEREKGKEWWDFVVENINVASGVFPPTPKNLVRFSEDFLNHTKNIDGLGVWFNEGEDTIYKKYCPDADLFELRAIESYYSTENGNIPWTRALENKKILVIHPFTKSIEKQFENREHLFQNPDILPPFELQTLQAVQSIATQKTPFKDWFEAFDYMCSEIKKRDFDIAIIGAGAYGLPLASFIKQLGKKAVHMGGATQILFGIKGKRWDEIEFFQNLYNEYWTRPLAEEVPQKANQVEDGCYW